MVPINEKLHDYLDNIIILNVKIEENLYINRVLSSEGGRAGGKLPPKPSSSPCNVAYCEPYIALNCVSGDLKFKSFWGRTPRPPLACLTLI